MCGLVDNPCITEINLAIDTEVKKLQEDLKKCECLPDCNSFQYEQSIIVSQVESIMENSSSTVEKGFLKFHFGYDEYTAVRRYGSYNTITFLSDCGGVLGLFLGISALSIIELFYFFILRVLSDFMRKFKKSTRVQPFNVGRNM